MAVIPFFCTRKGVLSRIDDSFLGFIPSKSQKSVSIPLHHHHADHLCWWAQNTYTRRHTHFFTKNVKRGFQNCSCILLVYLRIYSYPFVLSVFFEEGKHFLALDVKCGRGSNFQSSLNLVLRGSFPKLSITHFHISYHHHHLMCILMYT